MAESNPESVRTAPRLSIAADYYNRYPGELLTISLRFVVPEAPGAKLQFAMPRVMKVESYEFSPAQIHIQPSIAESDQDLLVLIPLGSEFSPGQEYQVVVKARLNTFYIDQYIIIQASLLDANTDVLMDEELRVAVLGKGGYLKYLPEIYEGDDFTSRFLMFFESFWKPVSKQIDQLDVYFDPMLTPTAFIPWLASWLGLPMDDLLPLERMRLLIRKAMMLSQCRGTLAALQQYLEIYTAAQVEIREQRARNFVLGNGSLGVDIALGKTNLPNSVLINLKIPQSELDRTKYSAEMYRRKIDDIVRTQMPAHVSFVVNCNFLTEA
jgi:phage tail-like protein